VQCYNEMHMEHDHHIHEIHLDEGVEESKREYLKFAGVLGGILVVSLILGWARGWELERFLSDFMAVFFVTFAAFKFINMENFAVAYRGYDVIAKRLPVWGYIYPFVEGVLGVAYLLLDNSNLLNVVTLVITGVGAVGVYKELTNKSNIMCACLGTIIRLPLSKVSLVEDVGMFAMAVMMLLL
jgi:hypothetical protein